MKRFIDKRQQARIAQLRLCPLPTPLIPIENGKILVFAPHPDDEVLGCGGTLALLRQNKCAIKVVYVTNSTGTDNLGADAPAVRRLEAKAALSVLGIDDLEFLDEPDGNFRNSTHFEKKIHSLLRQFDPDWLFLPSVLDYHRDHVSIGQAILSCWQRWGGAARAFIYEIWSPLPATLVVDIGSVIHLKKQAISKYALRLAHCDYLSASIGLASYRGLYLPKKERPNYAEAFVEAEKRVMWKGLLQAMLSLRFYLEGFLRG
ncbi:PIG-L deacetylase family protein [Nitrosomonas sp. Nm58]|uniref:PIG-L deacetylase family protein n=1 Tax=Nitrosomonas sp. Nm58 TaxID=200126 RepID=UPI0015A60B21|nr:PIG-L family deacetylase [Nitrosomonas sp. Nm58]